MKQNPRKYPLNILRNKFQTASNLCAVFHRRRAKVGEFAHPFGAKRRPSASGREYRADPSAAPGLPSKVPNDAMVLTHKTSIVPHEGMFLTRKTLVVPNDMMVLTHKTLVVPNDTMVLIHKTLVVPNDMMVSTHKTLVVPNEGTASIRKAPLCRMRAWSSVCWFLASDFLYLSETSR